MGSLLLLMTETVPSLTVCPKCEVRYVLSRWCCFCAHIITDTALGSSNALPDDVRGTPQSDNQSVVGRRSRPKTATVRTT